MDDTGGLSYVATALASTLRFVVITAKCRRQVQLNHVANVASTHCRPPVQRPGRRLAGCCRSSIPIQTHRRPVIQRRRVPPEVSAGVVAVSVDGGFGRDSECAHHLLPVRRQLALIMARQCRVIHTVSGSCPTDRWTSDVAPELSGGRFRRSIGSRSRVEQFLTTWAVLVVWVVLHVRRSQSLGFVDERPLVELRQSLPLGAQSLRDLRVVHLGVVESDATSLAARPHHERVHRSLDARLDRQRRRRRRRRRGWRRRARGLPGIRSSRCHLRRSQQSGNERRRGELSQSVVAIGFTQRMKAGSECRIWLRRRTDVALKRPLYGWAVSCHIGSFPQETRWNGGWCPRCVLVAGRRPVGVQRRRQCGGRRCGCLRYFTNVVNRSSSYDRRSPHVPGERNLRR